MSTQAGRSKARNALLRSILGRADPRKTDQEPLQDAKRERLKSLWVLLSLWWWKRCTGRTSGAGDAFGTSVELWRELRRILKKKKKTPSEEDPSHVGDMTASRICSTADSTDKASDFESGVSTSILSTGLLETTEESEETQKISAQSEPKLALKNVHSRQIIGVLRMDIFTFHTSFAPLLYF